MNDNFDRQRARVEARLDTQVWTRDKWKCVYCGYDMSKSFDVWHRGRIATDQFIPKSKGGSDRLENLRTACGACNHYKGNNLVSSEEDAALWLKINRE
jgi:5-methylcytosine-specific restriction endonuclease McrA